MNKLRVVVWDTQGLGRMAIRGVLGDPSLELVGVYTGTVEDVGQDAGALADRTACGIIASDDVTAVIALGADSVIYTSAHAKLPHLVAILESGSDVVSTNPFHNLGGLEGELKATLDTACAMGDASLHITGLFPGWVDMVGAVTTAICGRIDSIAIKESAYAAHYESLDTWTSVGMNLTAVTPEVVETAKHFFGPFKDTVRRIADMVGFELDALEFAIDHATAVDTVDLGWWQIDKGAHVAMRAGWEGRIGGKTVVSAKMEWYLAKEVNEGWKFGDDIYQIVVEGEPAVDTRIAITSPSYWSNAERATPTAMPAVNALWKVKRAPAGVLGIAEAGLINGRASAPA